MKKNSNYVSVMGKQEKLYIKSNYLISSMYSLSLMGIRLYSFFLYKIRGEDVEPSIPVVIHTSEIRETFGIDGDGRVYQKIRYACSELRKMLIICQDTEKERFSVMGLFDTVDYERGKISIIVSKDATVYFCNISKNYTIFDLKEIAKLETPVSIRLYELLRSKAYTPKGSAPCSDYHLVYQINELKFWIGMIDPMANVAVQDALLQKEGPNYELAWERLPKKMQTYKAWKDLSKYVLSPACKEISDKTCMSLKYSVIRQGTGGKACGVNFNIHYYSKSERKLVHETETKSCSQENQLACMLKLQPLRDKYTDEQILKIAYTYGYDAEKILVLYQKNQLTESINPEHDNEPDLCVTEKIEYIQKEFFARTERNISESEVQIILGQ